MNATNLKAQLAPELLKRLVSIHAKSDDRERQRLVMVGGCMHLAPQIDWAGSAQTYVAGLLGVLATDGQGTLVHYLAGLANSAGAKLGPDDRQVLQELQRRVEGLSADEWAQAFPPGCFAPRSSILRLSTSALIVAAVIVTLGLVLAATIFNLGPLAALLPARLPFERAAEGEALIVISPFAGELHDVSARPETYVRDAIAQWVDRLNMAGGRARYEMSDRLVESQRAARELGHQARATLVIWGEFDDVGGARTFVEIMRDMPLPDIQQAGKRLSVVTLPSDQAPIKAVSRECFLEGLPTQADYLAALSFGLLALLDQDRTAAAALFSEASDMFSEGGVCGQDARQAQYWLGYTQLLQEKYLAALESLSQAVKADPGFQLALVGRGVAELAVGQANAAEVDFDTALQQTYPEDRAGQAALQGNLGLALQGQGRVAEALARHQEALRLYTGLGDVDGQALAHLQMGSAYQRLKQPDLAEDEYAAALKLCQQSGHQSCKAAAMDNLGLLALEANDYTTAMKHFGQALELDTASGYALGQGWLHLHIGRVYLAQQMLDAARSAFDKALAVFTEVGSVAGQAYAHVGIGLAEHERRNEPRAVQEVELAARLLEEIGSPDAEKVRAALGAGGQ